MSILESARKRAKEMYDANIKPFNVIDTLNSEFEDHFFYLHHGNIFCCDFKSPIADTIYLKRSD